MGTTCQRCEPAVAAGRVNRWPERIRRAFSDGALTTIRRGFWAIRGEYREWRLGIDTKGSIDSAELGGGSDSFGYQPIPYDSFATAMRHVRVVPGESVFIDYGCGKGRAVVLASQLPFARVIGVERSQSLCEIARLNARRTEHTARCGQVAIVHADARDFAVPQDASVIFMFNPFDGPIVRDVLRRIRESLVAVPRPLSIIYAIPKSRTDVLGEEDWLAAPILLRTIRSDWQRLMVYHAHLPRLARGELPRLVSG